MSRRRKKTPVPVVPFRWTELDQLSWVAGLDVGTLVCNCRNVHSKITAIKRGSTTYKTVATLEDGSTCFAYYCLSPVYHSWSHPPADRLDVVWTAHYRHLINERST